jgi:hypothetical protein
MKSQTIGLILTGVNLLLLVFLLAQLQPSYARKTDSASILRGTGLEIVDDHGKVRASITVLPDDRTAKEAKPGGIIFRLIDTYGKPMIKIGADYEGGGMTIVDRSNGYIQLLAREKGALIKLKNVDGKEKLVQVENK